MVLLLNELGEKNDLKVSPDEEVRAEIQKQIKGMPGQEKMVLDYYQKILMQLSEFKRIFI